MLQMRGRKPIIVGNFPQKLHENETNWTQSKGAQPWYPLWICQCKFRLIWTVFSFGLDEISYLE